MKESSDSIKTRLLVSQPIRHFKSCVKDGPQTTERVMASTTFDEGETKIHLELIDICSKQLMDSITLTIDNDKKENMKQFLRLLAERL